MLEPFEKGLVGTTKEAVVEMLRKKQAGIPATKEQPSARAARTTLLQT